MRLNHSRHFHMPHVDLHTTRMELSPVLADDDELSLAIDNEVSARENDWELEERPDTTQLDAFWSEVQQDIRKDPDWVDFSKDA